MLHLMKRKILLEVSSLTMSGVVDYVILCNTSAIV